MVCAVHENAQLPNVFSRPCGDRLALAIPPRLASWMAAGHPDQVRLEMFLAHVEGLALPLIEQVDDPLALRLVVALPPSVDLLNQHDLDNYAYPLANRLARASGRQFTSVWSTKQHAETSFDGWVAPPLRRGSYGPHRTGSRGDHTPARPTRQIPRPHKRRQFGQVEHLDAQRWPEPYGDVVYADPCWERLKGSTR